MKASFSLDRVAVLILTVVAVAVGIGLLITAKDNSADMHPVESSIKNSDFPVCQDFDEDQSVGREGFRTVVYGRYLEVCDKDVNNLILETEITQNYLDSLVGDLSESPEVIFRSDCQEIPGFNGIIVEGNRESDPIHGFGDKIQLKGTRPVVLCQR